jgi:hypothetical protein
VRLNKTVPYTDVSLLREQDLHNDLTTSPQTWQRPAHLHGNGACNNLTLLRLARHKLPWNTISTCSYFCTIVCSPVTYKCDTFALENGRNTSPHNPVLPILSGCTVSVIDSCRGSSESKNNKKWMQRSPKALCRRLGTGPVPLLRPGRVPLPHWSTRPRDPIWIQYPSILNQFIIPASWCRDCGKSEMQAPHKRLGRLRTWTTVNLHVRCPQMGLVTGC